MKIYRSSSAALAIALVMLTGSSVTYSADHRDGVVFVHSDEFSAPVLTGHDRRGVGFQTDGSFAGVAADLDLDLTYGRDVVAPTVGNTPRR